MRSTLLSLLTFACLSATAWADGPADNKPESVRRLPKLGIEVPAEKQAELTAGLKAFSTTLDKLRAKNDATTKLLLPDVLVFHKAVHDALTYQEFHDPKELDEAVKQLAIGQERAEQLLRGEAPWANAPGLIVRGYISKIDGSVQPYGMVVPTTYTHQTPAGYRCDIWLHGRGETMTELNFIKDRRNNPGTFTPPRTLVLHPYGRWNNAFKFAGEIDVLEALADAQRKYAIDEDRIAMRGFSMGGAGAWHMAVHYPDKWFAANPGAGFSETPDFLKVFQKEDLSGKPWWEIKLWNLYDCNYWTPSLIQLPTIAYSGADDSQKQAADIMEQAAKVPGIKLTHIVAPNTKHAYSPEAKERVEELMTAAAKHGRPSTPAMVDFSTRTLRYNKCYWLRADEIDEHFYDPTGIAGSHTVVDGANVWKIMPEKCDAFSIVCEPGQAGVAFGGGNIVDIQPEDSQRRPSKKFRIREFPSDHALTLSFHFANGEWWEGKRPTAGLRKQHSLQGPIDDAFMDSFLMVKPTGTAWNEAAGKWSVSEADRAIEHWRRHFRGNARVKNDVDVTEDDIKQHNLVLWGDPGSNTILAKLADKLPMQWTKSQITVDKHDEFAADKHALIAIYPNPLNPKKYVVLNSGFTFRDYAHLNNARQVPMLPDWAVVDLSTPPGNVWPGKIVAADFFDEQWRIKKTDAK
ncbi:MAG TPA: prolyl oligopeptidase family serine peptidase [Pirellulaceae bacterium]|nr:prolyl oligopeptidase family serine peptidase [Pirellulaceae bacterium]